MLKKLLDVTDVVAECLSFIHFHQVLGMRVLNSSFKNLIDNNPSVFPKTYLSFKNLYFYSKFLSNKENCVKEVHILSYIAPNHVLKQISEVFELDNVKNVTFNCRMSKSVLESQPFMRKLAKVFPRMKALEFFFGGRKTVTESMMSGRKKRNRVKMPLDLRKLQFVSSDNGFRMMSLETRIRSGTFEENAKLFTTTRNLESFRGVLTNGELIQLSRAGILKDIDIKVREGGRKITKKLKFECLRKAIFRGVSTHSDFIEVLHFPNITHLEFFAIIGYTPALDWDKKGRAKSPWKIGTFLNHQPLHKIKTFKTSFFIEPKWFSRMTNLECLRCPYRLFFSLSDDAVLGRLKDVAVNGLHKDVIREDEDKDLEVVNLDLSTLPNVENFALHHGGTEFSVKFAPLRNHKNVVKLQILEATVSSIDVDGSNEKLEYIGLTHSNITGPVKIAVPLLCLKTNFYECEGKLSLNFLGKQAEDNTLMFLSFRELPSRSECEFIVPPNLNVKKLSLPLWQVMELAEVSPDLCERVEKLICHRVMFKPADLLGFDKCILKFSRLKFLKMDDLESSLWDGEGEIVPLESLQDLRFWCAYKLDLKYLVAKFPNVENFYVNVHQQVGSFNYRVDCDDLYRSPWKKLKSVDMEFAKIAFRKFFFLEKLFESYPKLENFRLFLAQPGIWKESETFTKRVVCSVRSLIIRTEGHHFGYVLRKFEFPNLRFLMLSVGSLELFTSLKLFINHHRHKDNHPPLESISLYVLCNREVGFTTLEKSLKLMKENQNKVFKTCTIVFCTNFYHSSYVKCREYSTPSFVVIINDLGLESLAGQEKWYRKKEKKKKKKKKSVNKTSIREQKRKGRNGEKRYGGGGGGKGNRSNIMSMEDIDKVFELRQYDDKLEEEEEGHSTSESGGGAKTPSSSGVSGDLEGQCGYCKKKECEDLKRCSRCRKKFYCSVDCQRKDWPKHKNECKKPK